MPSDHVPRRHDGEVDELLAAAIVGHHEVLVRAEGLHLADEPRDHAAVGVADPAGELGDEQALVLLDEARGGLRVLCLAHRARAATAAGRALGEDLQQIVAVLGQVRVDRVVDVEVLGDRLLDLRVRQPQAAARVGGRAPADALHLEDPVDVLELGERHLPVAVAAAPT
jgi:hypothetical protein